MLAFVLHVCSALAWALQYWHIHRKRTEMSPHVMLLALTGALLTGARFVGEPSRWAVAVGAALDVATQLALLELVTRVRREQRMLPESLFHCFTLRWKVSVLRVFLPTPSHHPQHLRRYFWQWDDFPSYLYFLTLATAATVAVLHAWAYLPLYGALCWLLDGAALICDAVALLPQVLRNAAEGNAEVVARSFVGAQAGLALARLLLLLLTGYMELAACEAVRLVLVGALAWQMHRYRRNKAHEY